jgi:hypothetical protein
LVRPQLVQTFALSKWLYSEGCQAGKQALAWTDPAPEPQFLLTEETAEKKAPKIVKAFTQGSVAEAIYIATARHESVSQPW